MLCPVCGCDKSMVYWSRKGEAPMIRRRECYECRTRFETQESFKRIIPPRPYRRKKNKE